MISSNEIIIRLVSDLGKNRLNLNKNSTFADLKSEISKKLNINANYASLEINNISLKEKDLTKLSNIKQIRDGIEIFVKIPKTKMEEEIIPALEHKQSLKDDDHVLSSNCNHPPKARCINCLGGSDKKSLSKEEEVKKSEKENNAKCNHGPGGKCLNCLTNVNSNSEKKELKQKWLCQHGPNGKCTHCLDSDKLQDVKHISFEEFLAQRKANCTSHLPDAKCNNCIPPSAISYKMNLTCKNHLPFPKAMCNKCMPPACVVKRQEYRHIDYAEFMNYKEVTNFVNEWIQKSFGIQKFGYLYGYYAEDPNYKGGIRAIIEAIYEPPQKREISGFEELPDENENQVNLIAQSLGFEKIGWIFTDINHDTFLDSKSLRKAARYQEDHKVSHPSGCSVSKFITVVVRTKKENNNEVVPEVYMISDQAQALERDNVFGECERRRVLSVREPFNANDILPTIVVQGKPVKEIEPDFFIVNIAAGQPKNNNFAVLKHGDFPVENRGIPQTNSDLKSYVNKFNKEPSHIKYSDFHLLLYLAKILDIDTAVIIGSSIADGVSIDENIELLIKNFMK